MDVKIILKSLGAYLWISILINDGLIPAIVLFIRLSGTDYNVAQSIFMLTQMFTPFMAGLWTVMYLEKYIEDKGNECLYIESKSKLSEVIKLFISYIVTNTPFFIWYCFMGKKFFYEWIHIVIVSFLFVGAAYFFSYLLKSISLALIPLFIYHLASVTGLVRILKKISFYEVDGMSLSRFNGYYNYFLVVTILLFVFGNLLNKYYENFNG